MKEILMISSILFSLSSFANGVFDFSQLGDELGNGTLTKGIVGVSSEVVSSEVCVFREAYSAFDRSYSIEFDYMGDVPTRYNEKEMYPFQFSFDDNSIELNKTDNLLTFKKSMNGQLKKLWSAIMQKVVCEKSEVASSVEMEMKIDEQKSVGINWVAQCFNQETKTSIKRFYRLDCLKDEISF